MFSATEQEIRTLLRQSIADILALLSPLEDNSDFFALGMDSLQATRLRKVLLKHLPIQASAIGLNIAFDFPTINSLTAELLLLQQGLSSESISPEKEMQALVEKYETFPSHMPRENATEGIHLVIKCHSKNFRPTIANST